MEICIRENYLDKVSLTKTQMVADMNGTKRKVLVYSREDLVKPPFNYKIIKIDDNYADCVYSDFDFENDTFTFNVDKYNARKQKEYAIPRISELKHLLASQDYQTIKYMQGELSEEKFNEVKKQCKKWRDEINALEANLQ